MNQGIGQNGSPYPPMAQNAAPYPPMGQQNFNQPPPGGMWPPQGQMNAPAQGGFGVPPMGNMNAPGPGYGGAPGPGYGAAPMATQWNTNAATAPAPPCPPPNAGGAGDIGFNFQGATLPGYIDSSLNPTIQPPTNPYFTDDQDDQNQEARPLLPAASAATEDEIKLALEAYAKKKCCYGQPEGIVFGEIQMKSGFKYNLTSTSETRETVWEFEPYVNQKVDGPTGGPLPGPWDLEVHPGHSFAKGKKEIHIAGTAGIKPCHSCCGNGHTRCETCTGMGGMKCNWCSGSGTRISESCNECTGTGRKRCTSCTGTGMVNCKTCQGKRSLYTYLKLIVKWDLLSDDFVSAESAVPNSYLTKRSKGVQVVNESGRRVHPVTNFPDESINTTSQNYVQKHVQAVMPNGAIREQKQSVEMIRIAEIKYTWGDKNGAFYMFGTDNRIYFPDYPKSCCYCCTIA